MTEPTEPPEAVGFREAEDGVDVVFHIGTDHELRMIVPAKAAIEWGRQLMLIGSRVQEQKALALQAALLKTSARSIWLDRDLTCMDRQNLDS